MTAKVVKLYPSNAADDPDNVLEQAVGEYEDVLVIGWHKDTGELDVRASSNLSDGANLLWMLESVKHALFNGEYIEPDNEIVE